MTFSTPHAFLKNTLILVVALLLVSSCTAVSSYQKTFLNDEDMRMAGHKTDVFDHFHGYREGAIVGIVAAESGGGCGCN